jgi:hypothetical protein
MGRSRHSVTARAFAAFIALVISVALAGIYRSRDAGMTIAAIDFQMLANAGYPPARFAAGDVIFAEGDKGDAMYVVRSGDVAIEHNGHTMETLGGGGIFGEMALIDGSPRSATVRAKRSNKWRKLMSKKAAEHHRKAAEHSSHATHHHNEAAKHHEAGNHEKAGHHAHTARGHGVHVRHHADEAAKAHVEEHGKK